MQALNDVDSLKRTLDPLWAAFGESVKLFAHPS